MREKLRNNAVRACLVGDVEGGICYTLKKTFKRGKGQQLRRLGRAKEARAPEKSIVEGKDKAGSRLIIGEMWESPHSRSYLLIEGKRGGGVESIILRNGQGVFV